MDNQYFELEKRANELRQTTLEFLVKAGTGHVTSCMSCAEIFSTLFYGDGIMRLNPKNPDWTGRDMFVLSKGQASPIYYAVLADLGFIPVSILEKFVLGDDGKGKNAPIGVHLQCTVPGVEFTTGSLGHGLGYGNGIADAAKIDGTDRMTYVLLGDGELYEGSNWPNLMYATHNKLDNLVAIVDRNGMDTNGFTEQILPLDPLDRKFEAFGWDVVRLNGHSVKELYPVLSNARNRNNGKPLMVIAYTDKGHGIKSVIGRTDFHGEAPSGEQAVRFKKDLDEFCAEHIKNGGYNGS